MQETCGVVQQSLSPLALTNYFNETIAKLCNDVGNHERFHQRDMRSAVIMGNLTEDLPREVRDENVIFRVSQ